MRIATALASGGKLSASLASATRAAVWESQPLACDRSNCLSPIASLIRLNNHVRQNRTISYSWSETVNVIAYSVRKYQSASGRQTVFSTNRTSAKDFDDWFPRIRNGSFRSSTERSFLRVWGRHLGQPTVKNAAAGTMSCFRLNTATFYANANSHSITKENSKRL